MPTAIATAIDNDLKDILQAVTFTGIDTANVGKIRELPKVGESLDTVPCILIAPFGKNRSDPLGTEGPSGRIYAREICLIDGHEGDYATDKPARELWMQQAINAIEKNGSDHRVSLPSASSVWSVEIDEAPTFDRSKLNQNYAYFGVVVIIRSSE